jgi:hypothetical protein
MAAENLAAEEKRTLRAAINSLINSGVPRAHQRWSHQNVVAFKAALAKASKTARNPGSTLEALRAANRDLNFYYSQPEVKR